MSLHWIVILSHLDAIQDAILGCDLGSTNRILDAI